MTGGTDPYEVTPLPWPCDVELLLPGSKSEANRLLVAAALSGRAVTVTGAVPSDDVRHLVSGLATLGYDARFLDEARGIVHVGPRAANPQDRGELFCGNAGTAVRFLVSVAAITPGQWTITGDAAMQRRPIAPLVAAWRQLGVEIEDSNGCPPVRVRGGACRGGRVELDASCSSQFVSSLLLVGAALPEGLDIRFAGSLASVGYAQLTCTLLRQFGVVASLRDDGASVRRGSDMAPADVAVGADWSAMGVWTCLQHLTGFRVRASNLHAGSGQPDEQLDSVLHTLEGGGERTIDVSLLPDQFLNLAITAALRSGTTRLVGAANLRHKECDRIAVMARELTRVGVPATELPDGLAIEGNRRLRPATIDPENDHRVAMAFALLGLLSPGITIDDPGCVAKSYPLFWRDLEAVRASRRCVAVVGMRGAGKSTFAEALARHTGGAWIDTDTEFERQHGPITAFVERNGWTEFREHEARIVARSIAPGHIVSTGGGAVETPAVRKVLNADAEVVWLDGPVEVLRARIRSDPRPRPSVTGQDVELELETLLVRRRSWYQEVCRVRIDISMPIAQQVERALFELGRTCRFPHVPGA
ncbi:MAG: 3-phosphoshikimate 1-carboxyvinyltransferase [Planctomycetota bacterium]